MKIMIYADPHWSQNSSIIVGSSDSTSGRLDALTKSYEWMYKLASDNKVKLTVNLGDTFDNSTVQANEHTGLANGMSYRDTKIPEIGLVGNHDMLSYDGTISAVSFMNLLPNYKMYSKPDTLFFDKKVLIGLLPYKKYNENELSEFINKVQREKEAYLPKRTILLSHNDIYGSDLGGWSIKSGIDPKVLSNNFDKTFNGHLHNGSWVTKNKVLNVGSLSGQNFSSKFLNWQPSVIIYDTTKDKVEFYTNPYALRFVTITAKTLPDAMDKLNKIDKNYTYGVSVKVPGNILDDVRDQIGTMDNIVSSRVQEKIDLITDENDKELVNIEKYDNVEGGYDTLNKYVSELDVPSNVNKDDVLSIINKLKSGDSICE